MPPPNRFAEREAASRVGRARHPEEPVVALPEACRRGTRPLLPATPGRLRAGCRSRPAADISPGHSRPLNSPAPPLSQPPRL